LLEVLAGDLKVVLHPDGVLFDFEKLVQTFAQLSLHAVKGEDLMDRVN
jgi:hypothetical protein